MSDESVEERRQQLREQAERKQKMNDAEPWGGEDSTPADGEMLEGEYLGSRNITKDFGGGPTTTPIYYVEKFDGGVVSAIGRTSLQMEMEDQGVEPGDDVLITFEGMVERDGKSDFYSYDVVSA